MSIDDELDRLVAAKVLFRLSPTDPSQKTLREIYASRSVKMFLDMSPGVRAFFGPASSRSLAVFDSFMAEKRITFGMDPFGKGPGALIARNDPPVAGICDFRIFTPKTTVRIFGGFPRKSTFIATNYAARIGLWFPFGIRNSQTFWKQYLSALQPLVSEDPNDYISQPFTIV